MATSDSCLIVMAAMADSLRRVSYDSAIVLFAIDGVARANPVSDPDPDPVDGDPWLTVAEIADELRVNPATVRLWISKGRLPAKRAGQRKLLIRG